MDITTLPKLVIWNARAGSIEGAQELRQALDARGDTQVIESTSPEHAVEAIQAALARGPHVVVAAGGDGTVHAVVNALGSGLPDAVLAILPLGTGNDLCRTLGIPLDPQQALDLFDNGKVRVLDLAEAHVNGLDVRFINMAAGGNSDRVTANLTTEEKRLWGPFCYLARGVDVLMNLEPYQVQIECDDLPPERFAAYNVIVGNGRTVGGGILAAPHAQIEDGKLDVIIVLESPLLDAAILAAKVLVTDYLDSPNIVFRRVSQITVRSEPPLTFSLDGMQIEGAPISFKIRPQAIHVVVGPDYVRDPIESA